MLCKSEVQAIYDNNGKIFGLNDFDTIFQMVDLDNDGKVSYTEFVAATMNQENLLSE